MPDAQEQAIAGLTNLLLTAPETPIRFGSGELSMYRDIATMDQGPGYLNGILSLLLNTTQPASQYSEEEQRAVPYFHRSRAAELLALLDAKFPNSTRRAGTSRQTARVLLGRGGKRRGHSGRPRISWRISRTLRSAPPSPCSWPTPMRARVTSKNEFAIYDSVLQELASQAQNVPLGSSENGSAAVRLGYINNYCVRSNGHGRNGSRRGGRAGSRPRPKKTPHPRRRANQAFQVNTATSTAAQVGARSPEYARVLERYLARLAEMKQIPQALGVLRQEIDRNPDDPGLYERLAVFLDQNRLGAEQEEVYRRAIARFSDKSWYDKLARFYLRYKRDSEFEQLTRDAVKTFSGS